MTDKLTGDTLRAEIAAGLGIAARRAWRDLVPDWRDREADITLAIATAAPQRSRPDLDNMGVLDELERLGLVSLDGDHVSVIVPPLPGPVVLRLGGMQ